MTRARVITTLRTHEGELKAAGIRHLGLFGSVARGDGAPRDVDLVALFEETRRLSLLDLLELAHRLTDDTIVVADASYASIWIANYLPARKAASVSPLEAMKDN